MMVRDHIPVSAALALAAGLLATPSPVLADQLVRIGIHEAKPIASTETDGVTRGFAIDVLEHMADREGWTIKYVHGSWSECTARLERGEIDLLFPMFHTEERERIFDFSSVPLLTTWGAVFAPREAEIESILDLEGKRVAVVRDDVFNKELRNLLERFDVESVFVELSSTEEVFEAIVEGIVDAGAVERIDGQRMAGSTSVEKTQVVFSPGLAYFASPAGRGGDLFEALDRNLSAMKADRSSVYHTSYEKWFGSVQTRPFPRWVAWILVAGGLVIVLVLAFNLALRAQVRAKTREIRQRHAQLEQEIRDRKRTEAALAQKEKEFYQAQKMEAIGRLAGGVAHDFSNIINVITGYCDLSLKKIERDEPAYDYIQEARSGAYRAGDLTRQLLAFSRKQVLLTRVVELNKLLTGLNKMLLRLLGDDVEFVMKLAPDLGRIMMDPGQIQQVVMNLAVNARDAMPRGGSIIIETMNVHLDEEQAGRLFTLKPGQYVAMAVSDTGEGMTQATVSRIFEPFYTTKDKDRGTGLGLSTVHGIVKQSGGEIEVVSEPGRGSRFTIYLPRVDKEAIVDGAGEPDTALGTAMILVVEDDESMRRMTVEMLSSRGFEVLEASEAQRALEIFGERGEEIDLVLTDVVMPGMSGVELGDTLLALGPDLQVLYMSGYTDETIDNHGVLIDSENLINKPFAEEALVSKIHEMLERRET
ncbi:MAG: transporter substrate-binding domain-containing protein [Deltaproteobacteria bacterium]|nr:transporter substrate-binding domain-containing protein [Deltaproteobacteria bacterium]